MFFFFQAEDGIRDYKVTGVQTCALPIFRRNGIERGKITRYNDQGNAEEADYERRFIRGESLDKDKIRLDQKMPTVRSEERRVGKEWRCRGSREEAMKKRDWK